MCVLQEVIPQSSNTYLYTKVNTADRSQNYITIYATAKQDQKVYQYNIRPFSNYCNYFHLSLDGSTNANDGEMVVDLNNVVPDISADTVEDYTWKIYVNDNDADGKAITVKDASIRVGDTPVYEAIDGLNEEIDGQEKEVMMEDPNAFVIKSFKVDKESPVSVGDTITLKADVLGNQSKYEFRFGTIFNGTEYFLSADGNSENYTDSNTLEKSLLYFLPGEGYTNKAVGTHTLFVDVRKKETGEVKRETIPYFKVDDMEITSLSAKLQSPQKVGTKIHLVAEVKNEVYHKYNCHKFYVTKDEKTTCLNPVGDAGYSIDWTPTEAGIYTITYQATSYCGQQEQAMICYEIKDSIVPTATPVVTTPPVEDTTKVYFDNSYANWGNVYAYVWDNNKVSTVIPMQVVDAEHKIYKAEIPNRYPNILFKNTESNWDKQTYDLQVPTTTNNCYRANSGSKTGGSWYAYTDPSEMKLTTNVELSHSLAYSGGTNVTISGGTAPYTYQYTERVTDRSKNAEDYVYVSDAQQIYGNWFQISQGLHCAGTYITDITVTDAKGVKATCQTIGKLDPVKIVNVKAMKVSPQKVGTEIQLKHDLQDACYYKYGIGSQFTITNKVTGAKEEFYAYYDHTITWTPKVAGKYQISIYICDSAGEEDTFSFDYEIYGGVEPTATPVVTVAPTNTPVVTTAPTATPVVTVAPTNTPVVTTAPTATPVVTVAPTNTPVVTTAPTATPVVTVAPTNTPVVTTAPTATPVVTVAPTNTPIADTTVVYFDNSQAKWSKVYAYVWDSNKTSTELSTTKIANNIYKVEVPNRYANIIFKNTSKTWNLQTNDLLVPKNANNCYKAYSGNRAGGYWYAYQPVVTTAPTATPVVTVAPTNTPVITTAPTATPVVTVAPTNTPVITTAPTATPVVTIAPTSTPVVTDKVAVEFNNKVTQWKQVYAYVWNNGGQAKVFAAAYDSNNRYIFNIEGRYANIIFKNTEKSWDQQTADLKMPSYTNDSDAKDKCFTPSSKANRTGGTWGSAVYLKDRKSFFPVLTANKNVINVGEELTLTLQTDYETPSAYNSRGLELQFEDGTQDVIRSFDGSSYTDFFPVVSGYQRTYSWGITKRGTVRIRYFVVGYEDHGEYSQPITVQVR
ncbi:MAG: starch-binding protein [Lachnospiraceae bacterium]|nr:starch-binding protein [Lachnospiraceae bacterium]